MTNENGVNSVNNISYTIEEHGIQFGFTYKNNGFMSAILQLPNTADSIHKINDAEFDYECDMHNQIFDDLTDYFYSDFKDILCAKASIEAGERVMHVEPIEKYYAAFCESGQQVLLEQGRLSDVFYFKRPNEYLSEYNVTELLSAAQESYLSELKSKLQESLSECQSDQELYDKTSEFMSVNFGNDWENSDNTVALDFYQETACDCRSDASYNLSTDHPSL